MVGLVWRSVDGAVLDQTCPAGSVYGAVPPVGLMHAKCPSSAAVVRCRGEIPRHVGRRFVLSGAFCPAVILEELKKPRACMKAAWITRASLPLHSNVVPCVSQGQPSLGMLPQARHETF